MDQGQGAQTNQTSREKPGMLSKETAKWYKRDIFTGMPYRRGQAARKEQKKNHTRRSRYWLNKLVHNHEDT